MRGIFLQVVGTLMGTAFPAAVTPQAAHAAEAVPLHLEARIPLGDVKGRIDHLAVDLDRQRLFVAELGNDSVGIVDLGASKVSGRIRGLKQPQGVGYLPATDTLYVANAGDGSVRLFKGEDLKETGRIELGDDADNVRIDGAGNQVVVGYGEGALAIIDTKENRTVAEIALHGHPESFRLESNGGRIFVNVPDAHAIEVADRESGKLIAQWSTGRSSANYPIALDEASRQVLVVFRNPATLTAFSTNDGAPVASAGTCGDADDVFVDAKRHRGYVSCGEGYLDVFGREAGTFHRIGYIPTASGSRTSLFIPELDRLSWPYGQRIGSRPRSGSPGRIPERSEACRSRGSYGQCDISLGRSHLELTAVVQGDQALLYMERYVEEGARTYSPLAGRTEAAPRYRPESAVPSFDLVTVNVPWDCVSVFQADPAPALLHHFVRPEGVLFAVHPETWVNDAVEGLGDIRAFPLDAPIRVAPTASTRTVLALRQPKAIPGHFLKLHYPVRISRFNRELRQKNIHNSVAVSRDLANLRSDKFAYLPDALGVAFGADEQSWGFLVRETRPRPFVAGGFLIPCFALYAGDLNHPAAPPLLVQMIARLAAEPVPFVVDRILGPIVECWARAARERGILLESHAQNTLLEVDRDFIPRRVVHRDFDVWVDLGVRRRASLEMPFFGRGIAADTDEALKQYYSLVYDQFIGHHFFDYVLGTLQLYYEVDDEFVRAQVREIFHRSFPDADHFFPARTMFKFRNESSPDRKVMLEDMQQAPVWR